MKAPSGLSTPLTSRLGVRLPIIQAPIGRVTGPKLVAAVSNAGALGMLGVTYLEPDDLRRAIRPPSNSPTDRSA
jgi:NAD(P)H-dependent flavin oxidoreductase YrpB (nitropropane dioxygenase family)